MRVLLISKHKWAKAKLKYIEGVLSKATPVTVDFYEHDAGTPTVVYENENNRISRRWFFETLVPLAEGYDAVVFHFEEDEGNRWGVDSGLRGTFSYQQGTEIAQLWIKSNERSFITYKSGKKVDRFTKVFIHECSHWFAKWLMVTDRTHEYDYEKEDMEAIFKTYNFTKYSLLRKTRDMLAILWGQKSKDGLALPLPSQYWDKVSQHFGVPNDAYPQTKTHTGTDFVCPNGTPVFAPADGHITESGAGHKSLGHYFCFEFAYKQEPYTMRVAHLLRPSAKGKYEKGQKLGETGSSGMSTGPHAHIEVWRGPVAVDKLKGRSDVVKLLEDPVSFFTKFK